MGEVEAGYGGGKAAMDFGETSAIKIEQNDSHELTQAWHCDKCPIKLEGCVENELSKCFRLRISSVYIHCK